MDYQILNELIKNVDMYKAHSKPVDNNDKDSNIQYESLLEHTRRTEHYFNKFWQSKKCDEFLDRFCMVLWPKMTKSKNIVELKTILKEMIKAIPIFHDLGKINPNFQVEKMKNKAFIEDKKFMNSNHSFISGILYLSYFRSMLLNEIESKIISKELKEFVLYHAYIIERHHSKLDKIKDFKIKVKLEENKEKNEKIEDYPIGKLIKAITDSKTYQKDLNLVKGSTTLMIKAFDARAGAGKLNKNDNRMQALYIEIYIRLIYSLLVASDYYATSEFMNGADFSEVSDLDNIAYWNNIYEDTPLVKSIRDYQKTTYPLSDESLNAVKDINILRSEIFCQVENKIKENASENIFYLEAPTGSGKSNTAINASFKLMEQDKRLQKIFYIYPFNTLVEQNLDTLEKIFANNPDIRRNIAVVNSITPIKMEEELLKKEVEKEENVYQKALLDRQFLNYPMILSTHVSLFNIIFGEKQSDLFAFHQLANSVIVLDEIQSYRNEIWPEIICYLKELASLLNIKFIIMSATLPNFDLISRSQGNATILLENPKRFFNVDCFKNRVQLDFSLLDIDKTIILDELKNHLSNQINSNKKILIEFIKKQTAYSFWSDLQEDIRFKDIQIEYLSGDDSIVERKRILDEVKNTKETLILVSTQVVEAGVDIDMDIGYKNISKLDSEEQFLGRINRSCKKEGRAYFFKFDEPKDIYQGDVRIAESILLSKENIREILKSKSFGEYYKQVLNITEDKYHDNFKEYIKHISELNYEALSEHMRLIEDDQNLIQLYLMRNLIVDGEVLDGKELWEHYVDLCENGRKIMSYAQWKIELSRVMSKMNNFMYQVSGYRFDIDQYYEKMGDIICLDDGDKYFVKDKFSRERLKDPELNDMF